MKVCFIPRKRVEKLHFFTMKTDIKYLTRLWTLYDGRLPKKLTKVVVRKTYIGPEVR